MNFTSTIILQENNQMKLKQWSVFVTKPLEILVIYAFIQSLVYNLKLADPFFPTAFNQQRSFVYEFQNYVGLF